MDIERLKLPIGQFLKPDSKDSDISAYISFIEAIHYKSVLILKTLDSQQPKKQFFHPDYGRLYVLDQAIGAYAWHCNHHLAHIQQAIKHQGNFQQNQNYI